jgi:hypothetical protein
MFINLTSITWTPVYSETQKLVPRRFSLEKFYCIILFYKANISEIIIKNDAMLSIIYSNSSSTVN